MKKSETVNHITNPNALSIGMRHWWCEVLDCKFILSAVTPEAVKQAMLEHEQYAHPGVLTCVLDRYPRDDA